MQIDLLRAAALIAAGEVVAVPTDTVYGLAAHPAHEERLFLLKGRPRSSPFIILLADREQIFQFVEQLPEGFDELAERYWPGALTLVVPTKEGSLGVRVPACEVACALLRKCGPLAVTSANRSGRPPALSLEEVEREFGAEFPVLEGDKSVGGAPSTILKWEGEWRVIRRGEVDAPSMGDGSPSD